jgi:hypothetical protein
MHDYDRKKRLSKIFTLESGLIDLDLQERLAPVQLQVQGQQSVRLQARCLLAADPSRRR